MDTAGTHVHVETCKSSFRIAGKSILAGNPAPAISDLNDTGKPLNISENTLQYKNILVM